MKETVIGFAVIILVFLSIFSLGFVVGGMREASSQRKQAIDAGVGRWVIDPVTGETEFRYGEE